MSDARSVQIRPALPFNSRQPESLGVDGPLKHVIDEYRHREQLVTCVCGWHGSTASVRGEKAAWDIHKAAFRITKR